MSNATVKKTEMYEDENSQNAEPVSEDGRYVTEEEYWENYYDHPDFNYEWNNGILEEVPVSDYENFAMCKWLMWLMNFYLENSGSGKLVAHEFGFRLALPEKVSIRKPDVAVVLAENLVDLDNDDCSFKGTYDLCVECLSDLSKKGIERDIVYKKQEYEKIGVREYYIIDADYHMTFYRLNKYDFFEHIKPVKNEIIQSEVLKGFQFRISDLYNQPALKELIEDELYYKFVLPEHKENKERLEKERLKAEAAEKTSKKECLRAEKERLRAEAAEKTAKEEHLRAERLAEKLRSLGVLLD